jgi:hypothetical protein
MRRLAAAIATVCAVGLSTSAADAAPITLVNADFEDPATILDHWNWSLTAFGWDVDGNAGTYQPTIPGTAFQTLPSGTRVGWSNGGSLSQLTSETFQTGETYSLQVDIGWRLDNPFNGGEIAIFAGDPTNIVGSTLLTAPIRGEFEQVAVIVSALDIAPFIGQQIGVLLDANANQVNFDNVALQAMPLPAGVWLLLSALATLFGFRRFKTV